MHDFAPLLAGLLVSCAGARSPLPDNGFAADPVWDDGRAEVSIYDGERVIYGAPRPHRAVLVVVKEDHDASTWIKADPPFEGRTIVPVLKLHHVREIPTPNYPYFIATSAFVRRDRPTEAVKVRTTCQEWCGTVFAQAAKDRLVWSGYFDADGEGERPLPMGGDLLLRDALPLQLRALPHDEGFERPVRVLDLLAGNRVGGQRIRSGTVRVGGIETVACGLGDVTCRLVELVTDEGTDRFWFEEARPHTLVRMEAADGRRLLLRSRERRAYWVLPKR